ncbi:hypothetical protein MPSEU_000631000 [Mayamaea pseudoterrestris]|nr:hypothetical protein MPSEU_000631000 [Mayamaea pseudoterrestris]
MGSRKVQFEFCLADKNHSDGMSHQDDEAELHEQTSNYLPTTLAYGGRNIRRNPPPAPSVTSTTSTATTAIHKNVSYDADSVGEVPFGGAAAAANASKRKKSSKNSSSCMSRTIAVIFFAALVGGIIFVIVFMLLPSKNESSSSAVARDETTGSNMGSINCKCPKSCKPSVLNAVIELRLGEEDDFTCRDRIQLFMANGGMDEAQACEYVSDEFPNICGSGCRPSTCADDDDDKISAGANNLTDTGLTDISDLTAANVVVETTSVCPKLIWNDEFDGDSLNATNWSYQNGDGCDVDLCAWGNGELQTYQPDNVFLQDGVLIIEARRNESGGYTSGRIRTNGLLDFQYGYVEASIQIPRGQGLWSAFWALPTDEAYGKWPMSGEFDLMENVGFEPDVIHGSIHYANNSGGHEYLGTPAKLPESEAYADSFHAFAVQWQKDRLRWFVDGAQYSEILPADLESETWPFNQRFHLLLNVAIGGGWPGNPDNSTLFPQQMKVDHVRVYNKPFGRLIGPAIVNANEQKVVYALQNGMSDYTFEWSVPSGATITSDEASSSATIAVEFGTQGGYVSVVAKSQSCGTSTPFSMPVVIQDN